ncbi:hypothetical protein GCK32_021378, partial [Trichostrongylus colubriformis]
EPNSNSAENERLQTLLRMKDEQLNKVKTRQHLSKWLPDVEQEFDKHKWKNMINSSSEYVFATAEV